MGTTPLQALRDELAERFGPDWRRACFGRATHFLSHSWGLPFNGFIQALTSVPRGPFAWRGWAQGGFGLGYT